MIYFIQQGATGPVKIGFSSNPGRRLAALQTAHCAPLVMLGFIGGTEPDERKLHADFANLRIRGEWFRPGRALVDFIKSALGCNPFSDEFDVDRAEQEAKSRVPTALRSAPAPAYLAVIPPEQPGDSWTVHDNNCRTCVSAATLEDAISEFINDDQVGMDYGWDSVRFPAEPTDRAAA